MMNSLESILNIMGENKAYIKSRKFDKNNVVYSNDLVMDLKRIKKAKSLRAITTLGQTLFDEYKSLESLSNLMFSEYLEGYKVYSSLNDKYGAEAANYYLRSLEEDPGQQNQAAGANEASNNSGNNQSGSNEKEKNWFKKMWETIKKLVSKAASFLMNQLKEVQNTIKKWMAGGASKLEENFKPENFKNMNGKVNLVPLPEWAKNGEMPSQDKELETLNKDDSNSRTIAENVATQGGDNIKEAEEKAFKLVYGEASKRPEKKESTVGEYLGASAGQRPKAMNLLSKNSLKAFEQIKTTIINNGKKAKELLNKINKDESESMKSGNKEEVKKRIQENNAIKDKILYANRFAQVLFGEQLAIRSNIFTAVKIGLKTPSDGKDNKDANNENKDNNNNNNNDEQKKIK